MYLSILCACKYIRCKECPGRFLGTRDTNGCKVQCLYWEEKQSPLQKQPVLLTFAPSLQSQFISLPKSPTTISRWYKFPEISTMIKTVTRCAQCVRFVFVSHGFLRLVHELSSYNHKTREYQAPFTVFCLYILGQDFLLKNYSLCQHHLY